MRRIFALSITALIFAFSAGTALADDVPDSDVLIKKKKTPAPVIYEKVTKYDMEEEDVDGTRTDPGGEFFTGRGETRHASLIKIRAHFVPEMLRSANDI